MSTYFLRGLEITIAYCFLMTGEEFKISPTMFSLQYSLIVDSQKTLHLIRQLRVSERVR